MSDMHDPYEDQLAAARYRAERDQARQELARLKDRSRDTTVSAYDLLPEDEREAIAWVREHGGVAAVEKRLMPDGYEWPRFEDGELVLPGDENMTWSRGPERILGIEFRTGDCDCVRLHHDFVNWQLCTTLDRGECARRPAALAADNEPLEVGQTVWRKGGNAHGVVESIDAGSLMRTVRYRGEDGEEYRDAAKDLTHQRPILDADGVPIELGDDLYSVEGGLRLHVSHIDRGNGRIATTAMLALDKWADPKMYTHRAHVLAADGRPLREGEKPYRVDNGKQVEIRRIDPSNGESCVFVGVDGRSYGYWLRPGQLTHELPESWERLEEDAGKSPCEYFDQSDGCGGCPHYPSECHTDKDKDLVRRAKALAGVK